MEPCEGGHSLARRLTVDATFLLAASTPERGERGASARGRRLAAGGQRKAEDAHVGLDARLVRPHSQRPRVSTAFQLKQERRNTRGSSTSRRHPHCHRACAALCRRRRVRVELAGQAAEELLDVVRTPSVTSSAAGHSRCRAALKGRMDSGLSESNTTPLQQLHDRTGCNCSWTATAGGCGQLLHTRGEAAGRTTAAAACTRGGSRCAGPR